MSTLSERLYAHVDYLSGIYPARNHQNIKSLEMVADYIEVEFQAMNFNVDNQYFTVNQNEYRNLIASYNTESKKRLIVGAHYDVHGDMPGADDNASAVAGLLEIARMLSQETPALDYRVDFVAYCLEEPPYFGTPDMGSAFHARSILPIRKDILGMICLEMIGCFSDKPGSQEIPDNRLKEKFPDRGNFVIVAGMKGQEDFYNEVTALINNKSSVRAIEIADPRLSALLALSDHRNYWDYGINAVMINDTAMLRNKNYHSYEDTIEKLDFNSMAEVVKGCYNAIIKL